MNNMTNPDYVAFIPAQFVEDFASRLRHSNCEVILFRGGHSRDSFLEQAARTLPANPRLDTYRKWDGFADALSGGIIDYQASTVVIFWLDADILKEADPVAFRTAIDVFRQVAGIQSSERERGNTQSQVRVFIVSVDPSLVAGFDSQAHMNLLS